MCSLPDMGLSVTIRYSRQVSWDKSPKCQEMLLPGLWWPLLLLFWLSTLTHRCWWGRERKLRKRNTI